MVMKVSISILCVDGCIFEICLNFVDNRLVDFIDFISYIWYK